MEERGGRLIKIGLVRKESYVLNQQADKKEKRL